MDEKESFSELEKKAYEVLFEGKENELKSQIDSINSFLSKEYSHSLKLPSSSEFVKKYELLNKGQYNNRVNTMNKKIILALGAAALIALGIFFGFNQGNQNKDQVTTTDELKVKVSFVVGDVKIKTSSTDAGKKPEVGSFLMKDHTLVTGNNATADLQFNNGSSLRIKANTEIAIVKLLNQGGSVAEKVSIKKGMLVANINKQKQTDEFEVVTPTAIAGVRGTRFLIVVNPDEKSKEEITKISVLDGSVGITKHRDGVPLTPEPILILDANDSAQEITRGGDFKKNSITDSDVKIIEGSKEEDSPKAETEESLFAKYGRMEVLSLDGGQKITGVITSMDDNSFTVHTVNGFVKVDRKKVISHDSKQLK